jgi:hypothetical protein
MSFQLEHVYKSLADYRADRRRRAGQIAAALGLRESRSYLMLLYWPRSLDGLFQMTIKLDDSGQQTSGTPFSGDAAKVQDLLAAAFDRNYADEMVHWLQENELRFLAGWVERSDQLLFEFIIDTDHSDFLYPDDLPSRVGDYVNVDSVGRPGPNNTAEHEVVLRGIRPGLTIWSAEDGQEESQQGAPKRDGKLDVDIDPGESLQPYGSPEAGLVALDLGNTSSTVAYLGPREREPEQIQLAELDPRTKAEAVKSVVWIASHEAANDGAPDKTVWEIGDNVITAQMGENDEAWPVYGAKRLLADPSPLPVDMVLPSGRRQIPRKLPGELLIARMLKNFHRAVHARAQPLTITYPSTYSLEEMDRLKKAAAAAWNRSLCAEQTDLQDQQVKKLIPRMLDEASAAAFFFLFRDFIRRRCLARELYYQYPRGLNLLLIDCGGGTTDVALIHAFPRREKAEGGQRNCWKVEIKVLGRTGHRHFGGDDITVATLKVLKAELACHLSDGKLSIPEEPAEFAAFYEREGRRINDLVPTRFRGMDPDSDDYPTRRKATAELWNWAEKTKIWLSRQQELRKAQQAGDRQAEDLLAEEQKVYKKGFPSPHGSLFQLISPANGQRDAVELHEKISNELPTRLEGRVGHVDALIAGPLRDCIRNVNNMIRQRLTDATRSSPQHTGDGNGRGLPDDSAVHWVYLVGNASRYPLVAQMVRDELEVRDLDQRLRVEVADLKNAVAKGAVLASRIETHFAEVEVLWDDRLPLLLPFNIKYFSLKRGWVTFFKEDELYSELGKAFIAPPSPPDRGRQAAAERFTVTLSRELPGDPVPTDFLTFVFPQRPRGPLEISFVDNKFQMKDLGNRGSPPVVGVQCTEVECESPIQRGDL